MAEQILFVDDEPNVLQSIQRTLRKRYKLKTATSGKKALEMIAEEGPFAVVVSDMQMPEMNGAELLSAVKKAAPQTTRIMLTGNADQQTAIHAVNHGDILRFLNKPTSAESISSALEAGLAQHRLMIGEQELLQNTLMGSISALSDVLALSNPEVFGRCDRIKETMVNVAKELGVEDLWQYQTTAMLSLIGCASLQPDLVRKALSGEPLDAGQLDEYSSHAHSGAEILSKIPRMEKISEAVRYQEKFFNGSGYPKDDVKGEAIPLGARILRAVLDLHALEISGHSASDTLIKMTRSKGKYDPKVVDVLNSAIGSKAEMSLQRVEIADLEPEMYLASDLFTSSGTLLVVMGQHTPASVKHYLKGYCDKGLIPSSIEVWVETDGSADEHEEPSAVQSDEDLLVSSA